MNRSFVVKTSVVAALAIALMVPVAMIRDLVAERQARRDEAVQGIAAGWGGRQTVAAPYLAVPLERRWTEAKLEVVDGKQRETRVERSERSVVRLRADSVRWTIAAAISEKARGIHKARVYGAKVEAHGWIWVPARLGFEPAPGSSYRWGTPRLIVGVSDPKGLRAVGPLELDATAREFEPGTGDALVTSGLSVPLPELAPAQAEPRSLEFAFSLELAGLEQIAVAPLGSASIVAMRGDWPHPSFQGDFLPASHAIDATGFSAEWKVSQFAGQGTERTLPSCPQACGYALQGLGVSFIEPAGPYQRLERASKYGFLFVGLTFAAFALVEILRRVAVHPVQYGLVGLALAMFFLLLTALSEHLPFAAAYAIASAACVAVISAYLRHVLRSARLALAFGAALTALYGLLYSLLQAEDYALLGGACLLFALLAAVMIATRRVDWYAITATKGTARA
ncbi:MAG: cell envelope integrity protein CreD [Clostridia bacterium]